ncbi:dodecin family protein [Rhodohalobacter mucosus]|uniref:Dodecin domain-containing protein n=1 Tax=Rhodohalobacter mucosus TaxID=2079485 RepID=A0A316TPJ5_9BACT|nr:dodecin family protein [Rhodohalobacter mucosus]PWN06543.1 dodecin domain-containing protein [Rhodohalobacter mucosus]
MSLAKVIEVISEGKTMEAAVENAVKQASKTVHNIKSVYVENINAVVEGESVTKYRINAKVTFVLEKD